MAASVAVEMGEVWISGVPDERLTAVGLGACVGLCLYDPAVRLGAMAHIVLPETPNPLPLFRGQPLPPRPGKCADTAVAYLLAEIVERGARVRHLRAARAGRRYFPILLLPNPARGLRRMGERRCRAWRSGRAMPRRCAQLCSAKASR